jgi:hypothetical protein
MMEKPGNHPHVIDGLHQSGAARRVEALPLIPAILLDIDDQRTAVLSVLAKRINRLWIEHAHRTDGLVEKVGHRSEQAFDGCSGSRVFVQSDQRLTKLMDGFF